MATPTYAPYLFEWLEPANGLGSYTLIPGAGAPNGQIDVVNNFNWTLSPASVKSRVPKVTLTEYRQIQSSELRGYIYSVRGTVSNLVNFIPLGAEPLANATQEISNVAANGTSAISEAINRFAAGIRSGLSVSTRELDTPSQANFTSNSGDAFKDAMNPYYGLYSVEKTGFTYSLPFYTSENMMGVNNTWGKHTGQFATAAKKVVGGLATAFLPGDDSTGSVPTTRERGIEGMIERVSAGAGAVMAAPELALASTAGAMIKEELKAFTGSSASDSIKIDFYLYNTFDNVDQGIKQIKSNWDLCYLLTYQNLPNRKSINLLDAPSLYEVEISGYKRLPLAYVSSITITNVGNVRLIDLDTGEVAQPDSAGPNIKMVPEAYHITLTLQSVLTNARNLFLFNADPGAGVSITVTTPPPSEDTNTEA